MISKCPSTFFNTSQFNTSQFKKRDFKVISIYTCPKVDYNDALLTSDLRLENTLLFHDGLNDKNLILEQHRISVPDTISVIFGESLEKELEINYSVQRQIDSLLTDFSLRNKGIDLAVLGFHSKPQYSSLTSYVQELVLPNNEKVYSTKKIFLYSYVLKKIAHNNPLASLIFNPDARVLYLGCSAGRGENSLAEVFSNSYNVEVQAPNDIYCGDVYYSELKKSFSLLFPDEINTFTFENCTKPNISLFSLLHSFLMNYIYSDVSFSDIDTTILEPSENLQTLLSKLESPQNTYFKFESFPDVNKDHSINNISDLDSLVITQYTSKNKSHRQYILYKEDSVEFFNRYSYKDAHQEKKYVIDTILFGSLSNESSPNFYDGLDISSFDDDLNECEAVMKFNYLNRLSQSSLSIITPGQDSVYSNSLSVIFWRDYNIYSLFLDVDSPLSMKISLYFFDTGISYKYSFENFYLLYRSDSKVVEMTQRGTDNVKKFLLE